MVDFQNDFCSPERGGDRPPRNTHNAQAAIHANEFARAASRLGTHVVYTRQVLDLSHLTPRQRRWEHEQGLCAAGSWGAELFIEPVIGATVVVKHRFDCWQSKEFVQFLEEHDIDGLVICGVELVCCVLYAVLGASERGYDYLVAPDLVSGQDSGDDSDNRAVRDFVRHNQPDRVALTSDQILTEWRIRHP